MTEKKHTPTPYWPNYKRAGTAPQIVDKHGEIIANYRTEQDADFSIRACNAHDDLVAACETLERLTNPLIAMDLETISKGRKLARAALAKAKAGA